MLLKSVNECEILLGFLLTFSYFSLFEESLGVYVSMKNETKL